MLLSPEDLKSLANIARNVLDWYGPSHTDETEESPGSLAVEAGLTTGASRDPHGEDPIYDEIFLAVFSDVDNCLYEVTVEHSTYEEALNLVRAMCDALGL